MGSEMCIRDSLGESSVIASRHLGESSVIASRHLGESSVIASRLDRNVFYVSSTFVMASQISTCDFWFTETLRPESDTIQRRLSLIRSKTMSLTSLLRMKTERPLSTLINQTRGIISVLSFSQMRGQKMKCFLTSFIISIVGFTSHARPENIMTWETQLYKSYLLLL